MIETTIGSLAAAAQVQCNSAAIQRVFSKMSAYRLEDLRAIIDGDITMLTAALHPIPIMCAFNLKKALTREAPATAPPTTPSPAPSQGMPTPGASPPPPSSVN